MDSDVRRREEWTVCLQNFLAVRLRTAPFADAARANPAVCVPSMVPNTQYLLDGILWAVSDHPQWAVEAWLVVQNHLKQRGGQCQRVSGSLAEDAARHHSAAGRAAPAQDRLERERTYQAHAAVQDVYLAFCVVDVLLKHLAGGPARVAVEKELPHLVCEYFPIFEFARSPWIREAVDEYRSLFLALLHVWGMEGVVHTDTRRRLEEHIRHRLKTSRDAMVDENDATTSASALRDGLQILMNTTGGSGSSSSGIATTAAAPASAYALGGGRFITHRTPKMVADTISDFLRTIFPARPRSRCHHCGVSFRTDALRSDHYRTHFLNHNFSKPDEKVVRLSYPSAADFVAYVGDVDRKGYHTKTTEVLEEAYRNGKKGAVELRSQKSTD